MIAISKIVNVSGSNQFHGADGTFFLFFKGIGPPLMSTLAPEGYLKEEE